MTKKRHLQLAIAACPLAWAAGCAIPAVTYHPQPTVPSTQVARTLAVFTALTSDDRVAQINMQRLSLEVALQFLAKHMDVDIHVDWDDLKKNGIDRDTATTTLNLFDATYADALDAVLWQLRSTHGGASYLVWDSGLLIVPSADGAPRTENARQKAADAAIAGKLREPFDPQDTRGTAQRADTLFYILSFSKKISLVVDWDELAKIGVQRDTTVTLTLGNSTTEEYLDALIAALKPPQGAVAHDIHNGMLRVSTQARLDAEKPRQP